MQLRRATMDDALDVLAWRNDPESIAASNTGRAVEVKEHLDWFGRNFESPDHLLLIAVDGGRKLGIVRFHRMPGEWLISINSAPSERGRGYGATMLAMAVQRLGDHVGAVNLLAEIKADNLASLRIFEKCGFHLIGAE
jgi:RimJ/RimL family protein N-acetyltransferase